jgi:hypothetical protein
MFWPGTFFLGKSCKMCSATFWAIFSQTHLVTLAEPQEGRVPTTDIYGSDQFVFKTTVSKAFASKFQSHNFLQARRTLWVKGIIRCQHSSILLARHWRSDLEKL